MVDPSSHAKIGVGILKFFEWHSSLSQSEATNFLLSYTISSLNDSILALKLDSVIWVMFCPDHVIKIIW